MFSSRVYNDEITMRGYKVLTSVVCPTIITAELAVTNGLGSPRD
jgi:hypothetical protein